MRMQHNRVRSNLHLSPSRRLMRSRWLAAGVLPRRRWGRLKTGYTALPVDNHELPTFALVDWVPTDGYWPMEPAWIGWVDVGLVKMRSVWPEAAGCCPSGRRRSPAQTT